MANLVAVYACLFLFFVESNFAQARVESLSLAFVLPLLGFVAGSFRHSAVIIHVAVSGRLRDGRDLPKVLLWLIPVFGVGALSFLVPGAGLSAEWVDVALVGACGGISLIVFAVSRDVAEFLRDTGLLSTSSFSASQALSCRLSPS